MSGSKLLLTGLPGVGKTTVLRRVAESLPQANVRGFVTQELRQGGRRVGFSIRSLGGAEATLAHVDIASPHRVGRYGVDVEAFERVALPALTLQPPADLYLVDEIGRMECFSPRFVAAMRALLDAQLPVVATVARRGGGFIAEVKRRPDVELLEITRGNRDSMPERVLARVARGAA